MKAGLVSWCYIHLRSQDWRLIIRTHVQTEELKSLREMGEQMRTSDTTLKRASVGKES